MNIGAPKKRSAARSISLPLKISLICIALLLLIVGVCSTLLIILSRNNILQLTLDGALTAQKNLTASFSEMVGYYGDENLGDVARYSLVKYCFSRFAEETSVLVSDTETISNISIQPEKILPLSADGEQQHFTGVIDGRNILIAGSRTNVLAREYSIYIVRDITSVYDGINQMILQFGLISIACIAAGVTLIILLVRFALRPLKSLGLAARRIAEGEYGQRAKVATRDEVGALAQDFNAMALAVQAHVAQLEETAQRQQLFIGGLTHEFKTPLTSVIGHSETLLYTSMPEDVAQNSLLYIHERCKWLERLTQKLLALITLQEEIELSEQPVAELLERVKQSTTETLGRQGITLEVACGTEKLFMDADLMQSLLINLVDNAAKASKEGQTVCIRAYGNIIEVADNGTGIPENEIPRITEPFYMVDRSRSKLKGGSGLGLALVKRIAQAHNIELCIDSALGKGTTLRLVFPR